MVTIHTQTKHGSRHGGQKATSTPLIQAHEMGEADGELLYEIVQVYLC